MILKDKLVRMRVIAREIEKRQGRYVSKEAKGAITEGRDRMEFRLKDLSREFQEKVQKLTNEYADLEASAKLEAMEKELELLQR